MHRTKDIGLEHRDGRMYFNCYFSVGPVGLLLTWSVAMSPGQGRLGGNVITVVHLFR
jgi:hypothetical protein